MPALPANAYLQSGFMSDLYTLTPNQSELVSISKSGKVTFYWNEIRKRAQGPEPKQHDMAMMWAVSRALLAAHGDPLNTPTE